MPREFQTKIVELDAPVYDDGDSDLLCATYIIGNAGTRNSCGLDGKRRTLAHNNEYVQRLGICAFRYAYCGLCMGGLPYWSGLPGRSGISRCLREGRQVEQAFCLGIHSYVVCRVFLCLRARTLFCLAIHDMVVRSLCGANIR